MLQPLTAYLFQYKKLSIPNVGGLRLLQHPAQLNVPDKLVQPPLYSVEIKDEEEVPAHQLQFLTGILDEEKEAALEKLRAFGVRMRTEIDAGGFDWKGIGIFKSESRVFPVSVPALQPVVAEKVIRQDATHKVLVGDRELRSDHLAERKTEPVPKRRYPLALLIAWALVFLSLLAIVVWLYFGRFKTAASGSRLPAISVAIY